MGLEKIAEYKKKLGMTSEELSEKSGVPLGTLNKILSGATKDPKLETLKSIAHVLGLTLDDFDDKAKKVVPEPTYADVERLVARNGKQMSVEQKMRLIKLLSEINDEDWFDWITISYLVKLLKLMLIVALKSFRSIVLRP